MKWKKIDTCKCNENINNKVVENKVSENENNDNYHSEITSNNDNIVENGVSKNYTVNSGGDDDSRKLVEVRSISEGLRREF